MTASYASDPGSIPGDSPFCTQQTQHVDLAYFWEKYPKIPLKSKVLLIRGKLVQAIFTPEGPQSHPSCLMRTALDLTWLPRKVQTKAALLTFTPLQGDTRQSLRLLQPREQGIASPTPREVSPRPSKPCEASDPHQQATGPTKAKRIYAPRKPRFDGETSQSEITEPPGSPQAVRPLRRRKTRSRPRDKLSRTRAKHYALPHSCSTVSSA